MSFDFLALSQKEQIDTKNNGFLFLSEDMQGEIKQELDKINKIKQQQKGFKRYKNTQNTQSINLIHDNGVKPQICEFDTIKSISFDNMFQNMDKFNLRKWALEQNSQIAQNNQIKIELISLAPGYAKEPICLDGKTNNDIDPQGQMKNKKQYKIVQIDKSNSNYSDYCQQQQSSQLQQQLSQQKQLQQQQHIFLQKQCNENRNGGALKIQNKQIHKSNGNGYHSKKLSKRMQQIAKSKLVKKGPVFSIKYLPQKSEQKQQQKITVI